MSEQISPAETYRMEAEELLGDIEEAVLDIEQDPGDSDAVNRLFRAMHTIKGSGSMFGFDDIAQFTHHVETALDLVREGSVSVTKELIDLVLASRDRIIAMLEAADGVGTVDLSANEAIILRLQALMPNSDEGGETKVESAEEASTGNREITYRIRFRPDPAVFKSGLDPVLLIEELVELGKCGVVANTEEVPDSVELDPEVCNLFWDILLTSDKGIDAIKDVFIFVEDDSDISIKEIADNISSDPDDPVPKFGDILVDRGDVDRGDLENALKEQKRLGDLLVDSGAVSEEKVKSALKEQQALKERKASAKAESVRVPSDKLDSLINLVGELVITRAQLQQVAARVENLELASPVEDIDRLTGELRDLVLNIRMMPIGMTFTRFRRLVRDLSGELGKTMDLVTEGAETEMDKTVIDRLGDPLVHLIRNSIDHGIESPEVRSAVGKPARGTIRLVAAHKGANVVITIEDDGKGLDPEFIRERAIAKGLITADTELSEQDTFALIFAPGFSTASEVTSVSGRGVGMDVVKREIETLRGTIEIESNKGSGTAIHLSLPLTLAIIDGLLVDVAGDRFVVPLSLIEECLELTEKERALGDGRRLIQVRGNLIPYIRLREVFDIGGDQPPLEETVVVHIGDLRAGLVVDHVIGDHQTVIKSLGKAYQSVQGVSGGTIMGDGRVALILDVASLLRGEKQQERNAVEAQASATC